ncbi:MAG: hypothetical protein H0T76_17750 [Nannocystis sp.]|nr:hypothetical protein [Nannocystis sp.]MBA3548329.1 hypothetical protein [Nannocystis sp.]
MSCRLARLVLPALLAALPACAAKSPAATDPGGKVCTQMGCINGLHLNLAKVTPWTAGAYTFVLELDGAAVTCTGALPLPACDQGSALRCDVEGKVQIGESGCALPPEQHGFSDIQISGEPTTVKLTIKREDQQLHSGELTPTYVTSRPNGPGCEPECRGAHAEVALP